MPPCCHAAPVARAAASFPRRPHAPAGTMKVLETALAPSHFHTFIPPAPSRSMEFFVGGLEELRQDPKITLQQAVVHAYPSTLKPFHGWLLVQVRQWAFRVEGLGWLLVQVRQWVFGLKG